MDLLKGKTILVTGVLTPSSIAFHTARVAQEQGATVVLTGYGRMSLVERVAGRLPRTPPVVELDVTDSAQLASLADRVAEHTERLDGVLHSVAFAPQAALGGGFLTTGWEDVARAVHVSAYSLQSVTRAALPLLAERSSIVGLDFDASRAWAEYDWMGVAKAGLESCSRYLASYLGSRGVRVNLVAAGPLRTTAAAAIGDGDFAELAEWNRRAPLGWDGERCEPVARACVALLSDWFSATTGEIVHVDGGAHAIGDRPGTAARGN
ncbi:MULTISPECIES: enoyl-ACP reductase FabI [Streptomyces]|uniref:Enoyl-[acyl-carrier-protein] reductase [NADH] n=2 Tax=Streptomyces TaxID=1883 RepID=A0A3M8EV78_9ACTN|nr:MULTISPECIES: enoyl-ACP reductase FabI [Streptomyces]KNE81929.1 enoyl-ACP reductase [Streptomyces fradiae]OFA51562.1 enoyl-[acyl-carrier-protein] reductase [Streptomyces fradiae]PQM19428.1 enoyl-[acyl-carrier-protein] reductase FabI [Streptomyces xinghaiensis]RKM95953.1 enoyl-[acyl-carrier-protein] reductase FabI [Streptomyces xinghaiensis]RNC69909.1 enoyl-[acyl-carrier-protein] reductase FabI [Streptomyces xinghaiensis]